MHVYAGGRNSFVPQHKRNSSGTRNSPSPPANRRANSVTNVNSKRTGAKRILPANPYVGQLWNKQRSGGEGIRNSVAHHGSTPSVNLGLTTTIHTCPHHSILAPEVPTNAVITTCPACPQIHSGTNNKPHDDVSIANSRYFGNSAEHLVQTRKNAFSNSQNLPTFEIKLGNTDISNSPARQNCLPSTTSPSKSTNYRADKSETANDRRRLEMTASSQQRPAEAANTAANAATSRAERALDLSSSPIDTKQQRQQMAASRVKSTSSINNIPTTSPRDFCATISDSQQQLLLSSANIINCPTKPSQNKVRVIDFTQAGHSINNEQDEQHRQLTPSLSAGVYKDASPKSKRDHSPHSSTNSPAMLCNKWSVASFEIQPPAGYHVQDPSASPFKAGWRCAPMARPLRDENVKVVETAILDDASPSPLSPPTLKMSPMFTAVPVVPANNYDDLLTSSNNTIQHMLRSGEVRIGNSSLGSTSGEPAENSLTNLANLKGGAKVSVATDMSFHQQLNMAAQTDQASSFIHPIVASGVSSRADDKVDAGLREHPSPTFSPPRMSQTTVQLSPTDSHRWVASSPPGGYVGNTSFKTPPPRPSDNKIYNGRRTTDTYLDRSSKGAHSLLTTVDGSSPTSSALGCAGFYQDNSWCRRLMASPACSCCSRSLGRVQRCSLVIIAALFLILLIFICIGALLGLGITSNLSSTSSPSLPPPLVTQPPAQTKYYEFVPFTPTAPASSPPQHRPRTRLTDAQDNDARMCGGSNMVLCSNGECRSGGRCDFFTDCPDLSDEQIGCDFGSLARTNGGRRSYVAKRRFHQRPTSLIVLH